MSKIIEIEELGFPKSLIIREGALVSELIDTKDLVNELDEQLRQYNVVRQSEQLICVYCGINPIGGNCPYPKKCSTKKKIKAN